jgi:hypothetical protein
MDNYHGVEQGMLRAQLRNYGGDREGGGMRIMEATENEASMLPVQYMHARF